MSLKTLVACAAITGTVASSTLMAAAPAEAAAIAVGSVINFSSIAGNGGVRFDEGPGSAVLNFIPNSTLGQPFQPINAGLGSGSFTNVGPFARILDLDLVDDGGGFFSLAAPKNNFVSFINLPPLFSGFNNAQFTLTKFIWNSSNGDSTVLEGFFTKDGKKTAAVGQFTSQLDFAEPSSWSMTIEAVPTPALLPGLIGMAVAALRKKQGEENEQEA